MKSDLLCGVRLHVESYLGHSVHVKPRYQAGFDVLLIVQEVFLYGSRSPRVSNRPCKTTPSCQIQDSSHKQGRSDSS